MKATIGKHVHWFNTQRVERRYFEWRHKKYVWEVNDNEHDWLDRTVMKLLDVWQTVLHYTVNQIQSRRKQKVRVRVDHWDTFSADNTLAHIIVPVLERLRENKQGAPNVDLEDVPRELHGKKLTKKQKQNGEVDDKHFERWDYILDAMIWSFREIAEDKPTEETFFTGESDTVWTRVDADLNEVDEDFDGPVYYRMDRGPNDTREIDWEGLDEYAERVQYGLAMFGKYYQSLWT
jgi:hypothetical protein